MPLNFSSIRKLFFPMLARGVSRTQSNICDEAFLESSEWLVAVNYFREIGPS